MARSKRILVLGDLHHLWPTAEVILEELRPHYDQAVFLGDYFDYFGDMPIDATQTAFWLAHSLRQPERIHLLGNHDLPYLYPQNPWLFCPGYTVEKCAAIERQLRNAPCDRFKLAYAARGWLFTHAGIAGRYAEGETPESVVARANKLLGHLNESHHEPWLAAGFGRGGLEPVGGITWLDWTTEFKPVPGFHQIVGHTPTAFARGRHLNHQGTEIEVEVHAATQIPDVPGAQHQPWQSLNWCLDTVLEQVALIDDNGMRIFNPRFEPVPKRRR
jgi:hypothetical protein